MAIEMLLVKHDIKEHGIELKWVATKQMIVDVLTKVGAPVSLFLRVLREACFILNEDDVVNQCIDAGVKYIGLHKRRSDACSVFGVCESQQ